MNAAIEWVKINDPIYAACYRAKSGRFEIVRSHGSQEFNLYDHGVWKASGTLTHCKAKSYDCVRNSI